MNSHVPVPPALAAMLVREYEAGLGLLALMRRHHIGYRRLRPVLAMAGVLRRRGTYRAYDLSAEAARVICTEYLAGATIQQIMKRFHVGELKIKLAFIDHNVEARPRGKRPRRNAALHCGHP